MIMMDLLSEHPSTMNRTMATSVKLTASTNSLFYQLKMATSVLSRWLKAGTFVLLLMGSTPFTRPSNCYSLPVLCVGASFEHMFQGYTGKLKTPYTRLSAGGSNALRQIRITEEYSSTFPSGSSTPRGSSTPGGSSGSSTPVDHCDSSDESTA